jgi:hypothetical protein
VDPLGQPAPDSDQPQEPDRRSLPVVLQGLSTSIALHRNRRTRFVIRTRGLTRRTISTSHVALRPDLRPSSKGWVSTAWSESSTTRRRTTWRVVEINFLTGCTSVLSSERARSPADLNRKALDAERARASDSQLHPHLPARRATATIREIGGVRIVDQLVRYHLNILEKRDISAGRARSRGTTSVVDGIPVLGRVAAGQPISPKSYEGT